MKVKELQHLLSQSNPEWPIEFAIDDRNGGVTVCMPTFAFRNDRRKVVILGSFGKEMLKQFYQDNKHNVQFYGPVEQEEKLKEIFEG